MKITKTQKFLVFCNMAHNYLVHCTFQIGRGILKGIVFSRLGLTADVFCLSNFVAYKLKSCTGIRYGSSAFKKNISLTIY
jgi:hypothetical protein